MTKIWSKLRVFVMLYMVGVVYIGLRYYHNSQQKTSPPQMMQRYDANAEQPLSYTHAAVNDDYSYTVQLPPATNQSERVKAGFFVLVRNDELAGMLQSMHDIESRFNHKFNYPWIFLNNEPFTNEFKLATSSMTQAKVSYGLLDETMWGYPEWIDQDRAANERELQRDRIPYGGSETYRHMCRFQSGYFFRHPLMIEAGWEYYWRVEPEVRYYCDLDYDPFLYMKQNNKKYGFNIPFIEHTDTVPTLWDEVRRFAQVSLDKGKNYFSNPLSESMYRVVTVDGKGYNLCHFWTNFEIARVDLWASEAYLAFFDHLDQSGGFFYERWGDAPVRSIFASLYLKKDEIHFFNDIGYRHSMYEHCPVEPELTRRCTCDPTRSMDYVDMMSCLSDYVQAIKPHDGKDLRTVGDLLTS